MKITQLDSQLTASGQITSEDIDTLAQNNVQIIVCNRPDNESADQPVFADIQAAAAEKGIEAISIPFTAGTMSPDDIDAFANVLKGNKKIHMYCRTGNRCAQLWKATTKDTHTAKASEQANNMHSNKAQSRYDIVIIGGGSGGIAVASSLLKRRGGLRIALVDPAQQHYYQPGWTMVGGGVFDAPSTCREMKQIIPDGVNWIQKTVVGFSPADNSISLNDNSVICYDQLVVSPGLTLNWSGIEGLEETLGKNGVTSNYRYDLAPYTWKLAQNLKKGKAIFTQPPMPIKCAGAPQKAMYLSADHWLKSGVLNNIDINFFNAGPGLFGVADYVPALMTYIKKYGVNLHFSHNLFKVDGDANIAWFKTTDADGNEKIIESGFDFMHVCPPQCAPEFISKSELADSAGWFDVNPHTLQHKKYKNIWGLGDATNTPNAKTMAAIRKQAPVVAENICNTLDQKELTMGYDGYGSCPLTVERGKIVLAEFAYGGKLVPTFPAWLNDGTQATKFAWILKADILPALYWQGMLKGREILAKPKKLIEAK